MILYIPKGEQDQIRKILPEENVAFEVRETVSIREMGTGSYEMLTVQANVAEVEVPALYRASEGDVRAFRLPSGRLILTDLEGNLDRIETPPPGR
ncbi:MAG: hypothetical protein ACUVRZ_06135 [Desulfobacca sp.]|uniref:hypothetical protein n=1 Tax=Desulfobacca sp. TaxID=2067990 RepID=UPI00404A0177